MSNRYKRKNLNDEQLVEIVNNNDESELSDFEFSEDSDNEGINTNNISENEDEADSSDEEVETEMQHGTWTNIGKERPRFPFTGKPGLNVEIEDNNNPLEFFELFITPEIAELISRETNRYAQQFIEKNPELKEKSRVHHWSATNKDEIMKLLAFFLLQGLHQKPDNKSYFSRRKILETPIFFELFTERRFHLLLKFLHFVDNEAYDEATSGSKRLYKLKPILDHLNKKFQTVYTPECYVSVDESLMMWKGRLGWKVFIPSKRARFGIKSFELCEAESGYVWNFIIYIGKETIFDESLKDESYGSKVVLELMAPILNQGYCVTMDNWFSSPDLYEKLCKTQTDAMGTLRQNRKGVPSEIKKSKLKKGGHVSVYKDKLMIMKWKDKKDICLISTTHDDKMIEKEIRGQKVKKPKIVLDYNKKMGGVDLSDAYLVSYRSSRKRLKKYYQKHFRHMVDICCLNSYLLYVKSGGTISRMEFQLRLIENLILKYHKTVVTPSGRPSKSAPPTRINAPHYPSFIPPTEKKQNPCRRCVVCYKNGERRETRYTCTDCNVALCAAPCFQRYHTCKDY